MDTSNLIPRIGERIEPIGERIEKTKERIERLDTAIFSGPPSLWRYPACIVRHIKVAHAGDHLWFRMRNISMDDAPGQKAPAFLFCYNKRLNFYVTVEGDASITGIAGNLKAPDGWQDPIFAHQTTYLVRMEIRQAFTYYRPDLPVIPALPGILVSAPGAAGIPITPDARNPRDNPDSRNTPHLPSMLLKKLPKINWSSLLTGHF